MRIITRVVVTAAAGIVLAQSTPIHSVAAEAGVVEVSRDGVAYSPTWSGILFDDLGAMVPGDSRSELFSVRNSGTEPGFLRITLLDVASTDGDLGDALTLRADTTSVSGIPVAVSTADPCWVLVEGPILAPGDVEAVTAELELGDLDGLAGRDGSVSLAIRVSLSDASTGALPPSACGVAGAEIPLLSDAQPSALATTGAELPVPTVVLGGVLAGAGLFLFGSARRRRREPSTTGRVEGASSRYGSAGEGGQCHPLE